jgi:hypothetical protein
MTYLTSSTLPLLSLRGGVNRQGQSRWFPYGHALEDSAMNSLTVELANCYGIRKMKYTFEFKKYRSFSVYASNGSMKTSLARTLKDYAEGKEPGDRIFKNRKSLHKILDEKKAPIDRNSVFVVLPYDANSHLYEKASGLLVNKVLREEYDRICKELDQSKEVLLEALKKQARSKRDLEKEISAAFTGGKEDQFYAAMSRIYQEALEQGDKGLAGVPYDVIFEQRVVDMLSDKGVQDTLVEYAGKYDELISKSTFFKKGIFEYYDASEIAKKLVEHGFFKADHTVYLNGKTPAKVTNEEELQTIIKNEHDGITKDPGLRKKFDELETKLSKNVATKTFRKFYSNNQGILPQLLKVDAFKQDVWKAYLKAQEPLVVDFMDKYGKTKKRKSQIEEQAFKEETEWDDVISIFNERFDVPFKVLAKNKVSVMLDSKETPQIGFIFEDKEANVSVERDALIEVLSQGESRALYLLDILFEARRRQRENVETLFVADDIADSFDYKNKYAIVEYLKEMADHTNFRLLILTHNFDFFRTLESRRVVPYLHSLMALKTDNDISLAEMKGIKNVFVKDWKKAFFADEKKRIASIPFMRNLLEFMYEETDKDYIKTTSLLHWKQDTPSITHAYLDELFERLFGSNEKCRDQSRPVVDTIHSLAEECLHAGDGMNFENKIVLSIAIRLAADKFMIEKIADPAFIKTITDCQTPRLLEKYEELFGSRPETTSVRKVLRKVVLMTPENIHLNSFMYEPIIDMSDGHLRRLYEVVKELK